MPPRRLHIALPAGQPDLGRSRWLIPSRVRAPSPPADTNDSESPTEPTSIHLPAIDATARARRSNRWRSATANLCVASPVSAVVQTSRILGLPHRPTAPIADHRRVRDSRLPVSLTRARKDDLMRLMGWPDRSMIGRYAADHAEQQALAAARQAPHPRPLLHGRRRRVDRGRRRVR